MKRRSFLKSCILAAVAPVNVLMAQTPCGESAIPWSGQRGLVKPKVPQGYTVTFWGHLEVESPRYFAKMTSFE